MNGAPEVVIGTRAFKYAEVKYGKEGGGNRGIRIWESGVQGDHEYKFSPNPHGTAYDKKQAQYYLQVATAIAQDVVTNGAWPAFNTAYFIAVVQDDVTLVEP